MRSDKHNKASLLCTSVPGLLTTSSLLGEFERLGVDAVPLVDRVAKPFAFEHMACNDIG